MIASTSHLILLPAYNPGPRLRDVVAEVLRYWQPVLVVVDGSTDGSEQPVLELARTEPALRVLVLPENSGKGAAVLAGAREAAARGFTHALVMDADGQHPAESIAKFMATSAAQPDALVLGRPIFPANTPPARRHGRKLSIGLVHFELMSKAVADPLFGFRVYPLAPLLAELGPRRSGRRYDFDTEAMVRLGWAGVPMMNLTAPVRYFSAADGGVSHFHYGRDNARLVWMHTRLIAELLFRRWPSLLRRPAPRLSCAWLVLLLATGVAAHTTDAEPLIEPSHRVEATAPAWRDLIESFAHHPDTTADFTERRRFPFRKQPVVLTGEVRVSVTRGLSLRYVTPDDRTVVLDAKGVLIRTPSGETAPPSDPHAAADTALRHILEFDLPTLDHDFEIYGERVGPTWSLAFVPRTAALRHNVGRITVGGEGANVRRIEIRRTATQSIEIAIGPPRPPAPFTAEEIRRFFR